MKELQVSVTTNGSGAGTGVSTETVLGKLHAIAYYPGTLATGATLTITCTDGNYAKPLLTKANAGTANVEYYPRDLVNAVSDGSALAGTSGGDRVQPYLNGRVTVTIASGGATATGKVIIYYDD